MCSDAVFDIKQEEQRICVAFADYTKAYDPYDTKIALKIAHTYRVAALCRTIAASLNLNELDTHIAWVCGMLHDIGRFEQVRRYNTFEDKVSVNHATLGADILFVDGEWTKYIGHLSVQNRALIEKAIRVHNMFRVPQELSKRELTFATILRDADKIDILRVNYETPCEEIYNVTTEVLKNSSVSKEVKTAFDERRCALRTDKTTPADHIVGHICLAFELVHEKSKQILMEQGYLFKVLEFESCNEDTREWFRYMKESISKKGI